MPDDIITLGGPRRQFTRERDEAIEELFHAEYARLAGRAFTLLGDWDLAGQVAVQAYLRLWRHWRRVGDLGEASAYLQRAVTSLAGTISAGRTAGPELDRDTSGEQPEIDTACAWREFEALRARRSAARRRDLRAAIAVAAVVAIAIGFPVLAGRRPASRSQPVPAAPAIYPRAVVAKFDLSGVISVVGTAARAWAIRGISRAGTIEQPGAATTYQLVGIDLRKNTLLYRVNLGRRPRAIAAGAGRVWLTTPSGQAAGQIVRIDPASGRIVQTLHLHAGPCTQLSFGWGHLFAGCDVGGRERSTLWRIDPVRQRGYRLPGMARGYISSLTAAPNALWYVVDFARISGLAHVTASRPLQVTARDPAYRDTSAGTQGLVYDAGSIWALGSAERLARIDAVTGDVVRHYSYRSYDPARAGGLDFLTAAGGWLWFLDNGYPFSGVLRVSEATGHPAGGVPIPPGSCGQAPCSLIYATPGSIWVPTAELLIRIDPSRLPG